jgi:hypothetical protein
VALSEKEPAALSLLVVGKSLGLLHHPPPAFYTRLLAAKQTHPTIPFATSNPQEAQRNSATSDGDGGTSTQGESGPPLCPLRLQPWLRATRPTPSRKIPIDLLLLPYRSASSYTTRSLEIRWACLQIWSFRRRVATFHVFLVKRKMAPRMRDSCRSCSPVEAAKCMAPFWFCLFTIFWVKDPWRLGRGFIIWRNGRLFGFWNASLINDWDFLLGCVMQWFNHGVALVYFFVVSVFKIWVHVLRLWMEAAFGFTIIGVSITIQLDALAMQKLWHYVWLCFHATNCGSCIILIIWV